MKRNKAFWPALLAQRGLIAAALLILTLPLHGEVALDKESAVTVLTAWVWETIEPEAPERGGPVEAGGVLELPRNLKLSAEESRSRISAIRAETRFRLESRPPALLKLNAGTFEGVLEFYLNGKLAGAVGERKNGFSYPKKLPKVFTLPASMLNQGENRLTLVYYSDSGYFELPSVELGQGPAIQKRASLSSFLNTHIYLAFCLLSLFISLYYLVQFINRKKNRTNLLFALANLMLFVYFFEMGFLTNLLPQLAMLRIGKSALPLFFCFLTLFFIEFFNSFRYRWLQVAIAGAGGLSFLAFYLFGTDSYRIMNIFTLALAPAALELVLMLVIAGRALKKRVPDALPVFIGILLGIAAAVNDFYFQFSGTTPLVWLQGWGILAFDIAMFFAMAFRSIRMQSDLERYTEEVRVKQQNLDLFIDNIRRASGSVARISQELDANIRDSASTVEGLADDSRLISETIQEQYGMITDTDKTVQELLGSLNSTYKELETQNSDIQETTATMEEMLENIEAITASLKSTSEFTDSLEESSGRVGKATAALSRAMDLIKGESEHIHTVTDAVNDLADRTHLLSMNAAIEAARAGQSGQGFAVVSGEIKKLAEQSSGKASAVFTHIDNIMQRIEDGAEQNRAVTTLLEDIASQIARSSQDIQNIYLAIREQRSASENIKGAMQSLRRASLQIKEEADKQGQQGTQLQGVIASLVALSEKVRDSSSRISEGNSRIADLVQTTRRISAESSKEAEELENLLT